MGKRALRLPDVKPPCLTRPGFLGFRGVFLRSIALLGTDWGQGRGDARRVVTITVARSRSTIVRFFQIFLEAGRPTKEARRIGAGGVDAQYHCGPSGFLPGGGGSSGALAWPGSRTQAHNISSNGLISACVTDTPLTQPIDFSMKYWSTSHNGDYGKAAASR